MKITTGKYDAATRTIPVTFTEGKIANTRTINAVVDAQGKFDKKATDEIITQQARGVAAKIAAGVIGKEQVVPPLPVPPKTAMD